MLEVTMLMSACPAFFYFSRLDNGQKLIYLQTHFPSWFTFDHNLRELAFDPKGYCQWRSKANIIEVDYWFKALNQEQRTALLKFEAQLLNENDILKNLHQRRFKS